MSTGNSGCLVVCLNARRIWARTPQIADLHGLYGWRGFWVAVGGWYLSESGFAGLEDWQDEIASHQSFSTRKAAINESGSSSKSGAILTSPFHCPPWRGSL